MEFKKLKEMDLQKFVNTETITVYGVSCLKVYLGEAVATLCSMQSKNVKYPGLDGWQTPLKPIKNPYFGYATYHDQWGGGLISPKGIKISTDHVESLLYRHLDPPYFVDTNLTCWQAAR